MSDDIFISVDCETSGPFPGRHALLAVGAVVVQQMEGRWSIGGNYYDEWAPPLGAAEDPNATKIHGLDLAVLRARGTPPERGAAAFAEWVTSTGRGRRVFVGYNAGFDWSFVLHALGASGVANPFHHAPLDLKSVIWGLHGGSWRGGNNAEALDRILGGPLQHREGLRAHNALDDALIQADMLIAILARLASAGEASK